MTTATAFGSLWSSSHPGTSSMGKLMALSLVTTLAAAVLFQPVLMGPPREINPEGSCVIREVTGEDVMGLDILSLFAEREADRYGLHTRHLNEQMVRVLKTIGYDVGFRSGRGQYLYDRDGRNTSTC